MPGHRGEDLPIVLNLRNPSHRRKLIEQEYSDEMDKFAHVLELGEM